MYEVEKLLYLIRGDQVKDYTTRKARLHELKFWMMELKNNSIEKLNRKYKYHYKWDKIKEYSDLIVNGGGGKNSFCRTQALAYIEACLAL